MTITRPRLFEISLGAVPPTLVFGPELVRGLPLPLCVLGLSALISLWLVLLYGPAPINARPPLRWFVILSAILAFPLTVMGLSLVVQICLDIVPQMFRSGPRQTYDYFRDVYGLDTLLSGFASIGPTYLAIKYLPSLLRKSS